MTSGPTVPSGEVSGVVQGIGSIEAFLLFAGGVIAVTALFEWVWNITVRDLFAWRQITFWQSFRLLLLASVLTGRFFQFSWKSQ